jgi:hypothetical protein
MSAPVEMDLRLPIGGLFALLGVLIGGYGIATNGDASHYEQSLGVNINLWWGLVMLVFGTVMLLLAFRARGRGSVRAAQLSPEGQATEEREHRSGLER